ncbi:DUF58 domain-containing protein [Actinospica sp. MGRD01-02]|uniref:DUF58 domain-containing protein n=1 Tax=Actinospica acidithermotolerans TaxID=2828514 RepID=A0A941IIR5_9ACTN|nr:DUF58 domain-containing protein [Actinospica acidithermotolerans]MBR7826408.1 DUF58 domain-containing protein [Actinospica acidithermotolerans]
MKPSLLRALGGAQTPVEPLEPPSARPTGWRLSERAHRLTLVAACALIGALVSGHAWAFAFAAGPVVWLLLAATPGSRPERVEGRTSVPVRRCFEGEPMRARIELSYVGAAGGLDPAVYPGPGVELIDLAQNGAVLDLEFTARRWGRWSLGTVDVDVYDRGGLARQTVRVELGECEIFPLPDDSSLTPIPTRLPNRLGEHTSRQHGQGLEFVGVRPYRWGDRQRRIHWAATTRRGSVQISEFAAEQATDAVVLLDAFGDVVGAHGGSTLDDSVRVAAGIARAYLRSHDRVGIVSLGGRLRWLSPGTGGQHLLRIVESVLEVRRDLGYQTPDLDRVPPPAQPNGALVYAVTPLADDRFVDALQDLALRGNPAVVVEIPVGEPRLDPDDPGAPLALRLWRLDGDALRFSLTERGLPVVTWEGEHSLDLALAPLLRRPVHGRTR